MTLILPILLAGGKGERLWPLTNQYLPKHCLSLLNSETLLQQTLRRVQALPNILPPLIVSNHNQRFLVGEQVRQLNIDATILLEKEFCNTASAMTSAILYAQKLYQDVMCLVCPCDQYLEDENLFSEHIQKVAKQVKDHLVLFGVAPQYPATNYGYIQVIKTEPDTLCPISHFHEKPDSAKAEDYFHTGDYYWNTGMFLFKTSTYIAEMMHYVPEDLAKCQEQIEKMVEEKDFKFIDNTSFCSGAPIDKVLFEKTENAYLWPLNIQWYDLGDWKSIYTIQTKDEHKNVITGETYTANTSDCYLYSNHLPLVTVGLHHCAVIVTEQGVLVTDLEDPQHISVLHQLLKECF